MATSNDPTRPSTVAFTTPQRQRLEAVTFARRLLMDRGTLAPLHSMLELADYIVTGDLP